MMSCHAISWHVMSYHVSLFSTKIGRQLVVVVYLLEFEFDARGLQVRDAFGQLAADAEGLGLGGIYTGLG